MTNDSLLCLWSALWCRAPFFPRFSSPQLRGAFGNHGVNKPQIYRTRPLNGSWCTNFNHRQMQPWSHIKKATDRWCIPRCHHVPACGWNASIKNCGNWVCKLRAVPKAHWATVRRRWTEQLFNLAIIYFTHTPTGWCGAR